MAFDITSWGSARNLLEIIPRLLENFRVLKTEVDGARAGLKVKDPVLVASTGNLTLSGVQTIDGISGSAGIRVLAKDQTLPAENGLYVMALGAWARTADAMETNVAVWVSSGTVNNGSRFVLTTEGTIVAGTTPLAWTLDFQASDIVAGNGLVKVGNQLDLVETAKAAEAAASADAAATSAANALSYKNAAAQSATDATTNGAAQVALAVTQAGLSHSYADAAAASAGNAATSANTATDKADHAEAQATIAAGIKDYILTLQAAVGNVDGGNAQTLYLEQQVLDGGNANG